VLAKVTSHDLAERLTGPYNPAGGYARKVAEPAGHEPHLWRGIATPDRQQDPWETTIPVSIRDFREAATVEDYIDTTERLATPPEPPAQPLAAAPLDIPHAVGLADAVRESRNRLPALHPAGPRQHRPPDPAVSRPGRLQLTDVRARRPVQPGHHARQSQATTARRAGRTTRIPAQGTGRPGGGQVHGRIGTLIKLREIRHSLGHGDARAKAVAAYASLGLSFPIADWPQAWSRISSLACGALDVLREEAHAGLQRS
jgi:hypothetical protein